MKRRDRPLAIALGVGLLTLAIVGHVVAAGSGSGHDEPANRGFGLTSYQQARAYLDSGTVAPQVLGNEHGTFAETSLILVERALGLTNLEEDRAAVYRLRHHAVFTWYLLGVVAFFFLASRHLESRRWGALAALVFVLSPRVFQHSAHNMSDIAFMSACIFGFLTLDRFLERRTFWTIVLHALATAIAMNVRIVGLLIPVATLVLVAPGLYRSGLRRASLRHLSSVALYLLCTAGLVMLTWPFLWGAPVENFGWAVGSMANIAFGGTVVYFGELISTEAIPWHYNPVWIAISTPLVVVALFSAGLLIAVLRALPPSGWHRPSIKRLYALGAWIVPPLVAPMVLGSTLFDGWRHHFFVWPAIALVAMVAAKVGCDRLSAGSRRPAIALGLFALLVPVGVQSAHLYPHLNLYFNPAGAAVIRGEPAWRYRFDQDYWSLGFREALEWLVDNVEGEIVIYEGHPMHLQTVWLSPEDRARVRKVPRVHEADFFVANHRPGLYMMPATAPRADYPPRLGREIHRIERNGVTVITIRDRRRPE